MTSHSEAARLHLDLADKLSATVAECRNNGQHERAGRIAQHQRSEVKLAEVAALLHIGDQLERIADAAEDV